MKVVLQNLTKIFPSRDNKAGTVVVDTASQRIFASDEDRIEYFKRVAAEKAERQAY